MNYPVRLVFFVLAFANVWAFEALTGPSPHLSALGLAIGLGRRIVSALASSGAPGRI